MCSEKLDRYRGRNNDCMIYLEIITEISIRCIRYNDLLGSIENEVTVFVL